MKYLLQFEEPCAAKIERSGGKGANLALLSQGGFPVPAGFIVTAQAYRDFIGTSGGLIGCASDLAFHEPTPLPACGHPLPALRGEGRERGDQKRFMAPTHVQFFGSVPCP